MEIQKVVTLDTDNIETYDPTGVDILVKGNVETDKFLRVVLKHHNKNKNRLTHAFWIRPALSAICDRSFILTDAVVVPKPSCEDRVNAVITIAKSFLCDYGGALRVNFLTPNGHVSEKVQESLDAVACVNLLADKMPEFPRATIYQLDAALNPKWCATKYGESNRPADIISASSLAEANAIVKSYLLNKADVYGFVFGADIPIVLNSRANLDKNEGAVNLLSNSLLMRKNKK